MKIFFITSNPGKVKEASSLLKPLGIEVEQLKFPYPEIQADSLEEVVEFGIRWLKDKVSKPFFIEDSGLFIEALEGFPGVYSAYVYRTIGLDGILKLMEGIENRRAYFKSVIGYYDGKVHIFVGKVYGKISHEKKGTQGFGYDPIFVPDGYDKTFAEMTTEEKNAISHRGKALKEFHRWLKENLK
ncbi:non-canonical purine NTP pyrophosphatase [Thermococcus chitonophagus]|uniref:dITP/XTP pyrophosphatase n=1 Tax=Thermococcus chitonophagus TaxID=54262 RepID=A0A160VRL5_9EURY|nr:XTP/dITP diphosphatase [Thermococcus chitonophagus]ASJ15994.1 non-canonical purine NTP pyrophosphatase [Thermococcus chitonophagus]CUX77239.1 Xanthosine/inosine triphosphate pyrophosphatase [Thermococcus chitonophagus]